MLYVIDLRDSIVLRLAPDHRDASQGLKREDTREVSSNGPRNVTSAMKPASIHQLRESQHAY